MFGGNKAAKAEEKQRIEELERQIAELQAKLEMSESELESVNTSTHLGIWKCYYDENGNQKGVYYSDEFRRMLGFSKQELPDTLESLGKIIHPDDTPSAFGAYGEAEKDKTGRNKYDISYRILTKSGDYKWFHAAGGVPSLEERTSERVYRNFF